MIDKTKDYRIAGATLHGILDYLEQMHGPVTFRMINPVLRAIVEGAQPIEEQEGSDV